MRPALRAMAEQQELIKRQAARIAEQDNAIDQLRTVATRQRTQIQEGREQIATLGRGLQAIARLAGIERQVTAAMRKRADEQNPAQPIPEPPAEPAPFSTPEAETPEAFANVMTPGLVPGSTNDVAADATTTNYTPGDDIPAPAVKQLVDVTRPVDGTQNPRPLDEVRTLTDVRVGDPMNPAPAFPLRGPFEQGQRLGAREQASNRTMAAMRLARLRMQAGVAQGSSDFEVAAGIEREASFSTESIEAEIRTLEGVQKAASRQNAGPRNLVPKAANAVGRTVPSMAGVGERTAGTASSDTELADSDLFD